MHRGDPFPRCFGGPDQTALVRPPPATRQKLNPRKQTAASPCPRAPVRLWAKGEGPDGSARPGKGLIRPLPSYYRPLPSKRLARTACTQGVWLHGSSGNLSAACLPCLSVGLCSRCSPFSSAPQPQTGSTVQATLGRWVPEEPRAVKKLPTEGRRSLCSGPPRAPGLFSKPGCQSTFCTISAYRCFFVRSLLSLWLAPAGSS